MGRSRIGPADLMNGRREQAFVDLTISYLSRKKWRTTGLIVRQKLQQPVYIESMERSAWSVLHQAINKN